MKKTAAAFLGFALAFTAHAQTATALLNNSHINPSTTNGATTAIMMLACKASREGIKAYDFAQATYKHYSAYKWSQANFDSLVDGGYGYAEDKPQSDCSQIAIDVIDAKN